jgi:hypothetical protein
LRVLRERKGDGFVDVWVAGQHHDDPVDPGRDTAVRSQLDRAIAPGLRRMTFPAQPLYTEKSHIPWEFARRRDR